MDHLISFNKINYIHEFFPGQNVDQAGVCAGLTLTFLTKGEQEAIEKMDQHPLEFFGKGS